LQPPTSPRHCWARELVSFHASFAIT
jgi:hypothetical protein